jgi:hypothetical protein
MTVLRLTSAHRTKLAVRCTGHGSPIVLVHGAVGDSDAFAVIEARLAQRHSVWVDSRQVTAAAATGP